ncbi:uncharacterized protein FOMMEDRAFT_154913 [Fomitiporia mediterranea MF3/22]|uniref:uncharacterized protein n=1 Tax=Fomitiporia mediterranea (strain MF3/22) TaxID=694068 RepID=UPI0004408443|nr:uncharacterized protein FOMMEDRAFT_154913 [Fomitiporia mediterranea MF3/22]EJD03802.1 hypothetical protein FOMMEDRAFT_154913 [Fomitiporia mediterranea MF3/22]
MGCLEVTSLPSLVYLTHKPKHFCATAISTRRLALHRVVAVFRPNIPLVHYKISDNARVSEHLPIFYQRAVLDVDAKIPYIHHSSGGHLKTEERVLIAI